MNKIYILEFGEKGILDSDIVLGIFTEDQNNLLFAHPLFSYFGFQTSEGMVTTNLYIEKDDYYLYVRKIELNKYLPEVIDMIPSYDEDLRTYLKENL